MSDKARKKQEDARRAEAAGKHIQGRCWSPVEWAPYGFIMESCHHMTDSATPRISSGQAKVKRRNSTVCNPGSHTPSIVITTKAGNRLGLVTRMDSA